MTTHPPDPPAPLSRQRFATTRWSMVQAAGGQPTAATSAALSSLCEVYWPPLYAYLRRSGCSAEEAADTVQGFFARRRSAGKRHRVMR